MAEVVSSIAFSSYSMPNGSSNWSTENSDPAFPTATHQLHGDPARVISGVFSKFSGSGNSVIRDKTALTTNVVKARITTGTISNESEGVALTDANGVGWAVLININNTRLFAMNSGFVLGSQIGSNFAAITSASTVDLVLTRSLNKLEVIDDGVVIHTVTISTANETWYASGLSRNQIAGITGLSAIYDDAVSYTITGMTSPLVMGEAVSVQTTGFTGTGTTITAGGMSLEGVTFDDGEFTGTWPQITEAIAPTIALPAVGVTVTATEGTKSAIVTRNIDLSDGWIATEFGVLIDDKKFLGGHIEVPPGWHAYYLANQPDVGAVKIYPDGRIDVDGLGTFSFMLHKLGSDNSIVAYMVTLNDSGEIVVVPGATADFVEGNFLNGNYLKGNYL